MKIRKNITNINFRMDKNRKIDYVVVHYTAGKSDYEGAAYDNTCYFKNVYRGASAHYFVDKSDTVWQCVEDECIAWHVGDRNAESKSAPFNGICTNSNSIGIEMVSYFKDGKYFISDATQKNASALCAYILKKYNLGSDRLICHFDVTKKNCPMPFVTDNSKNQLWFDFVKNVEENMGQKFRDIENHWAREYIKKLSDYGIVSGDGNGNFRPDAPVTRAEVAKIVSNALLILGK